jgi:hypothetical protein
MGPRLSEQFENVLIVDGVVDQAARAARAHETHAPQQPQLVRRSGLADADERGDVADAELARRQRVEDPHACRIAEDAERVSKRFDRACIHQQGLPRRRTMRTPAFDGRAGKAFCDS